MEAKHHAIQMKEYIHNNIDNPNVYSEIQKALYSLSNEAIEIQDLPMEENTLKCQAPFLAQTEGIFDQNLDQIIEKEKSLEDKRIQFSKFQLYKKIGSGAFGTVFLARYKQNSPLFIQISSMR
jgi:hypothetical protein